MRFWMNAAILTVCGVMNTVLTSCGKALILVEIITTVGVSAFD